MVVAYPSQSRARTSRGDSGTVAPDHSSRRPRWQAGSGIVPGLGTVRLKPSAFSARFRAGSRDRAQALRSSPKRVARRAAPAHGLLRSEEMEVALASPERLCSLPFAWVGVGGGGAQTREKGWGEAEWRLEGGDWTPIPAMARGRAGARMHSMAAHTGSSGPGKARAQQEGEAIGRVPHFQPAQEGRWAQAETAEASRPRRRSRRRRPRHLLRLTCFKSAASMA